VRTRLIAALLLLLPIPARAEDIRVADPAGLSRAIAAANPGDRILLAPGDYRMPGGTNNVTRPGAPGRPITVRAITPGKSRIHSATTELFKIAAPHWIFEGIDFVGTANTDHAFHIVAGADNTILRNNRMKNFHAAVKANPEGGRAPNGVVIERNVIFNDAARQTSVPVTAIDVVGGDRWVLRENFIADYAKGEGDNISYGAFLKGGGRQGVIERNLVICEWKHAGGYRIGLSLGGGGTDRAVMAPGVEDEHQDGILRNNIVANCPNAEGIYLNKAARSKVYNNTVYNAYGILARYRAAPSTARNNVISGALVTKLDGALDGTGNIETGHAMGYDIPGGLRYVKRRLEGHPSLDWVGDMADGIGGWLGRSSFGRGVGAFDDWFVAPRLANFTPRDVDDLMQKGSPLPEVQDDFCGQKRLGATDLGAIEYTAGRCDPAGWAAGLLAAFD
jgi:hypothetical protein